MYQNIEFIYKPFQNINECSLAMYINKKYEALEEKIRFSLINSYFKTTYEDNEIRNFLGRVVVYKSKFPFDFVEKLDTIDICLEKLIKPICNNSNIFIKSSQTTCILCGKSLEHGKEKRYIAQLYYHGKCSTQCNQISIQCFACSTTYYLSYYTTKDGIRKFYENVIEQKFIAFTQESVFEVLLLKSLTSDIVFKHASFSGFTNSYNALFEHDKLSDDDRSKLIDKRLCESWFYYNLLKFRISYYKTLLNFEAPNVEDLDEEIVKHHDLFSSYFLKKWLNHKCMHPKCSTALNIDGNHKVTRLTCLHVEKVFLAEINCTRLYISLKFIAMSNFIFSSRPDRSKLPKHTRKKQLLLLKALEK